MIRKYAVSTSHCNHIQSIENKTLHDINIAIDIKFTLIIIVWIFLQVGQIKRYIIILSKRFSIIFVINTINAQ